MLRLGTVAKPLLHEFRNAWSRHIRMQYTQRFHKKCPRSLSRLQSLSFVPQVLGSTVPWTFLEVQFVANRCGIHSSCFSGLHSLLANALDMSNEFRALCSKVLEYRLEKNKTAAHPSETSLHGTYQDGAKSSGLMTNRALFTGMPKRASCASKKLDGVIAPQPVFFKITQDIT